MKPTISVIIIVCSFLSCEMENGKNSSNEYEGFIHGLDKVHTSAEVINDPNDRKCSICNLEFKDYFKYYNKLSMDSGWTIESYNCYGNKGGGPLILAFKNSNPKSILFKKRLSINRKNLNGQNADGNLLHNVFEYRDSVNFYAPIHISSEKLGYFQFLVFALTGEDYCKLAPITGYPKIIVSQKDIKEIIYTWETMFDFSRTEKRKALKIDPTPTIELFEDSAFLRIVTFHYLQGFIETKYSLSRSFPHKLKQIEKNILVDCGRLILFD